MSQHVSETCNESDGLWLPLTEYSVRSGVSLSTIRRKIKSNSLHYRLEKGRYLILFSDSRPSPVKPSASIITADVSRYIEEAPAPVLKEGKMEGERWAVPLIEKAVGMVSDAFENTLREKDERIRLLEKGKAELEERVNELRLLVRVLEEKYQVRY